MPANLPATGKTVWRNLIPLLESMQILSLVDQWVLERYCLLRAWSMEAALDVKKHGHLETRITREGNEVTVPNPATKLFLDYAKEMNKYEQQFGLTASARASLSIERAPTGTKPSASSPFRGRRSG